MTRMTRSTATAAEQGSPDLGALPVWDLDDLYPGMESSELTADLERMEAAARNFHQTYAGHVPDLDGDGLAGAIRAYEAIDETLSRVMSYAGLVYSGDMIDPQIGRFYQGAQERVNAISTNLVFFTLDINRLDEAGLQRAIDTTPALARYAPWLRDIRLYREHQLSDEMERLLHEKNVVGRAAWHRLFDETVAALRFPVQGHELTCAEATHKLSDRSPVVRRAAAETIGRVLGSNIRLFSLVTNTLAKDKEIEDKWRNFAAPVSARNLSNRVEDSVVEALVAAVKAAYPALSHRYYAIKARWFGQDHLDYWDRNAPLPEDADRSIPWDQARRMVLDAYGRFSPAMGELGARFFDNRWIDAPVRPGKAPGAFAHPTVPSAHPYLLVNYQGKTRDVMTLAHELGHGVHQILAGRQGYLLSETPLTLAETASVFGEMLTFQSLLAAETNPVRRRVLLAGKVEDMLNTVVRQIAFFDFEARVHAERRAGELTPERLGEVWLSVQSESLGPVLRFDEGYRNFWAYIPHFIHSPFYVYAYAFGDCLVNSLYATYLERPDGFADTYMNMLSAAGTLRHKDLLAPFGLDASDPAFWQKGLTVIRDMVDALERDAG
jgi:oligoendopeptidase F